MPFLLFALTLSFYLFFQSSSIYGGDAGDLVSAAYTLGVAHPPGYPLYTALGAVLTHIPVGTVAWRMSLLSSVPAALTIALLFMLLRTILKNTPAALVGAVTFAVTYIFWLYAITPEVFALHILFVLILFYLMWEFHTTKSISALYLFALIGGISLAHHHIVVFAAPAFVYLFLKTPEYKKLSKNIYLNLLGLLTLGVTPYLYVVLAARESPMINWNEPYTVSGLITLVTRATYGTFQSGPLAGQSLISRLLEIPVVLEFLSNDFTILGVIIASIGAVYLFKGNRTFFFYAGIAFISVSFLYFFYAFYPVDHPFAIATLERFLLPGYLFFTMFLTAGVAGVSDTVFTVLHKRGLETNIASKTVFYLVIFLLLPGLIFYINYPKLYPLKTDTTPEHHGVDVLATPAQNAVLFLQRDSTLFDTQYMYFTHGVRPDIIPVHYYRFYKGELTKALKRHYPTLIVPDGEGSNLVKNFMDKNYAHHPLYANIQFRAEGYTWVRYGLVYRLYKPKDIPDISSILSENDRLWKEYSDPLAGSLGQYRNLMLANILDFYKEGSIETGLLNYDAGRYRQALGYYRTALRYDGSDSEIYFHQGLALSKLSKCGRAQKSLLTGLEKGGQKRFFYRALSQNARECFHDPVDASKWQKLYENDASRRQTKLKELWHVRCH